MCEVWRALPARSVTDRRSATICGRLFVAEARRTERATNSPSGAVQPAPQAAVQSSEIPTQ
jgi:hypothetical protein